MTNHFTSCKSSLYAKVSFVDCEYSPEKRRVFLVLQVRKKYLTCKSILQLVSPCFFFSLRMLRLMVLSHTIFSKIVVVLMICWDLDQALTLRQHCRMQRNCAGRLWTKKSQQSEDKHDEYILKYKKHTVKLVPQARMGREATCSINNNKILQGIGNGCSVSVSVKVMSLSLSRLGQV